MTAAKDLLDRLPHASLIVGKGGVGKTTCAVGLAALLARRGERTLLVSTDPAAALASVIGEAVSTEGRSIHGQPNLDARQLSATHLRAAFLDHWRDTIADIVDRGTYLDRDDVNGLVDAALPGADEIFALLALAEILAGGSNPYTRIVVDTAPTGHTLRLLALPETFAALLSMLDLMQEKHRFMVRALTHRYRRDRADDFIDDMRRRIDGLRGMLTNGDAVAAVVVTRDEVVVAAETARLLDRLRTLKIRVDAVVSIGSARGGADAGAAEGLTQAYWIPRTPRPPRGLRSVAALVQRMRSAAPTPTITGVRAAGSPKSRPVVLAAEIQPSSLVRSLTIVGGKGGVGKSTIACALALAAVDADARPTLLVSTDPAPSIADAFGARDAGWAHADVEHRLDEAPSLTVRQMDADAAFSRARDRYQSRIDALFDGLTGRGVDVQHDRAIIRDLLALAPPGIDELFALSILGDALAERQFARIIVDPAPTGHLLRLLEMPALAIEWTHHLLRLLLKYRDIVGLGNTAQDLLDFAKRTRALDTLLHDTASSALLLVSLDEPVVRRETERLVAAAGERAISVAGILWNRVRQPPAPLTPAGPTHQFFAEEMSPPPLGVAELRRWTRSWRALPPTT